LQDGDTKRRHGDTWLLEAGGLMHVLSNHLKDQTMTRYLNTALGAIATLGIVLGVSAAPAHQGGRGGGTEGSMGQHGPMSGAMHGGGMAGQQLMSPQERDALREKMASAKTPDERQALVAATRADMQKRAKDRGMAPPEHPGQRGGMGAQGGHGSDHRH